MISDRNRFADFALRLTRRHFLSRTSLGIGSAALASLLAESHADEPSRAIRPAPALVPDRASLAIDSASGGVLRAFHHSPKAKRVISLFMSGGPSQLDLFDYKPLLNTMNGKDLPESVRMGQRLTGMSANQATLPMAGSIFKFARHGESGTWVSELLPHTAKVVDDLCVISSVFTEAINHDPAITFFQTGATLAGRPSLGSWLSYGLGSTNQNLPTFCVLISQKRPDQPLYSRLWGNGFLPSVHQGVEFRAGAEPVLFLENPPGISSCSRRKMLDRLRELHEMEYDATLDRRSRHVSPSMRWRIGCRRRCQRSCSLRQSPTTFSSDMERIPGDRARSLLTVCWRDDWRSATSGSSSSIIRDGTITATCPAGIRQQCRETDQPCAALIEDLKQRGMLDETLVVWGGEFGRTNYSQGKLTASDYGRDHHPRCFTSWMAGAGIKPGITYGATDPFGYSVVSDGVHVHDLHATILHLLGVDHERLTYKHQGRYYRLTDVFGKIVKGILA